MIERNLLISLDNWQKKDHRKPLILRGARQVGKSSVVRDFASRRFKNIAEINLEANPEDADLFLGPSTPTESLRLLSARLKTEIRPGDTLLFIDEIQKRPEVLASLRFFFEKMPELHVIAAGSLLDFALRKAEFSMPVGRIEYCYLGPLSFGEFLRGVGEAELAKLLEEFSLGDQWPQSIHARLLRRLKDYWIVGGMPESVANFAQSGSYAVAEEIKRSITETYRDDFGKYGSRIDVDLLRRVYERVPTLVGRRAKYVAYDREASAARIGTALELLTLARVITRVRHTSGTGVPLGAQAHDRLSKYLFVDVGLQLSLCDLNPIQLEKAEDLLLVNQGSLAEQFIGQHLLYLRPAYLNPELYYWERTERNAAAEVDYLISVGGTIIPVEVKSGAAGRMQSLQIFTAQRKSKYALRFSSALPGRERLPTGTELISLPLYFVEQTERLVQSVVAD